MRLTLLVALSFFAAAAFPAAAIETRRRPPEPIDRGERVIRTPDTSQVPADLTPRQPRDIQISVDPTQRRREGRETRRPVRR